MAEHKRSNRRKRSANGEDGPAPVEEAPATVDSVRAPEETSGDGLSGEGPPPFGRVNWVLSIVGVVALVAGFLILSQANAQADNLPARLAPPMILGAYLLIFVAIILRAPSRRAGGRSGERDGA